MFPLRDRNPTELVPWVTMAFIGLNVLSWLVLQGMGQGSLFVDSLCTYGTIPGEVTGALPPATRLPVSDFDCAAGGLTWETLLTSMFMHGGWMHLIGNMWFLWVFGNNIEDSMGHVRFVLFYLIAGVAASGAHIAVSPESAIPTVGASGAISGVMGAYLLLYPKVRIDTLFFFVFFIRVMPVAAWVMLVYWFALQLASGTASLGYEGGGVAFWAHIGGFVAGVLLIKPFERNALVGAKRAGRKLSREEVRELGWF